MPAELGMDEVPHPYCPKPIPRKIELPGSTVRLLADAEADAAGETPNPDVEQVLNDIEAMRSASSERQRLPISSRTLCELHRWRMAGVRGRTLLSD